jgi:hypothetical protein
MLERIKSQIMTRNYNKQKEQMKWNGAICPKIKKRVDKNIELAKNCYVDGAGDGVFAVAEMYNATPTDYILDLKSKTCSCNRWQKSGIPCPHVLSSIRDERTDPLSLVDRCYSVEMHNRAYGNIVFPCQDKSQWECMNGPVILPPLYKKHVGRPTKNRRKAPGEVDNRGGGKKMCRRGVIMHCSYCGLPDHNRSGCYWFKHGLTPPAPEEANVPPTEPSSQQPVMPPVTSQQSTNMERRTYQETLVDTMAQQVIWSNV